MHDASTAMDHWKHCFLPCPSVCAYMPGILWPASSFFILPLMVIAQINFQGMNANDYDLTDAID